MYTVYCILYTVYCILYAVVNYFLARNQLVDGGKYQTEINSKKENRHSGCAHVSIAYHAGTARSLSCILRNCSDTDEIWYKLECLKKPKFISKKLYNFLSEIFNKTLPPTWFKVLAYYESGARAVEAASTVF
jgi:hypothetical protein